MASATDEAGRTAETGRLAVRGTLWVLVGQGASQVLRLGSNLVLARLLVPEYFGLMALVQVFSQAVNMLSDVGLRGSVVHHHRGEEPDFLATVYTVQLARGVVLCGFLALLAPFASRFYHAPDLVWLIPLVGLGMIFGGFESPALYSLVRRVRVGRRVMLDVAARVFAVAVTVAWALISPSVMALVGGNLAGAAFRAVASFFLVPGDRPRFGFDRVAARDVLHFGRWILLSSGLTYLFLQGDRILLGRWLDTSAFGVYSIAAMLAFTVVEALGQVSGNVLFPSFARLARDTGEDRLNRATLRLRLGALGLAVPPLLGLALVGRPLVGLLYDARYADAGWMVEVLAIGALGTALSVASERLLMATGRASAHMWGQLLQAAGLIAGLMGGAALGGIPGAVVGVSVGRWLGWAGHSLLLSRFHVWSPALDLPVAALAALLALRLVGAAG